MEYLRERLGEHVVSLISEMLYKNNMKNLLMEYNKKIYFKYSKYYYQYNNYFYHYNYNIFFCYYLEIKE